MWLPASQNFTHFGIDDEIWLLYIEILEVDLLGLAQIRPKIRPLIFRCLNKESFYTEASWKKVSEQVQNNQSLLTKIYLPIER